MPQTYFSDRENGPAAKIGLKLDATAWGGLVALIHGLISNGGFGVDFPDQCPDGQGPTGTDAHTLGLAIRSEVPDLDWPIRADCLPKTITVMDLLELCHDHVAQATPGSHHPFWDHHHLNFDRKSGQEQFRERVNRILSRNGLAYELSEDGTVTRLAPPVLQETLTSQIFNSGDSNLDALLEAARTKFLDPDSDVRRESLEKLWDAWERVKTLGDPTRNKRESTRALLDKAAMEPAFRKLLESEALSLTEVGNSFHIRHSEAGQVEIRTEDQVDYLFHRLFAMIWLVMRVP